MAKDCKVHHMHIYQEKNGVHYHHIVPVSCKSWECPKCREKKSSIVTKFIRQKFKGKNTYMWTLTFFRSKSALQTWIDVGECWNLLRTYVRKKYGHFEYIRVVEPHKKGGYPHIHVLLDRYVDEGAIGKKLTEWGFGWNFQSQAMPPDSGARYISKYLTKEWPDDEVHLLRLKSKTRIVQCSRGLGAIFFKVSEWCCVNHSLPSMLADSYAKELYLDLYACGENHVFYSVKGQYLQVRHYPFRQSHLVNLTKGKEVVLVNDRLNEGLQLSFFLSSDA